MAFPCHIMCIKVCCPLKYVWTILIYNNFSYLISYEIFGNEQPEARLHVVLFSVFHLLLSDVVPNFITKFEGRKWGAEAEFGFMWTFNINYKKKLQSCSWWVLYTKYSLIRTSFSLSCLASSLRFIKLSSSNFSLNFPQWFTFTAKLPNNLMWTKLEIGV